MTTIEQSFQARDSRAPASHIRLLEPHEMAEIGPPEAVRIPLDLVDPSPANPRRALLEINELADNIKRFTTPHQTGLMQPVTVRRVGERYELISGHRRLAAWKLLQEREPTEAQWRTIPAVIKTADDDESYLMLLSSQLHSKSWAPREEAAGLERLAETRTLREVGAMVNRSEGWVSKRLRVYADVILSGWVQSGQLSTMVAEELLLLPDAAMREDYAEQAVEAGWTAGMARREVNKLKVSKQLTMVARQAREMLTLLSGIDPAQVPLEAAKDLYALSVRIQTLATGRAPVFPTLEEAQRAAGVNPNAKPNRPVRQNPARRKG